MFYKIQNYNCYSINFFHQFIGYVFVVAQSNKNDNEYINCYVGVSQVSILKELIACVYAQFLFPLSTVIACQ